MNYFKQAGALHKPEIHPTLLIDRAFLPPRAFPTSKQELFVTA